MNLIKKFSRLISRNAGWTDLFTGTAIYGDLLTIGNFMSVVLLSCVSLGLRNLFKT